MFLKLKQKIPYKNPLPSPKSAEVVHVTVNLRIHTFIQKVPTGPI